MLNHTVRTYLPVFQDQLRTSVLGRATGRKTRNLQEPGATDEDEAKPSPATDGQVRKFFDAWHTGDDAAQADALSKIVRTWRADNAAGGVPVHAHLPLPTYFAKTLARLVRDTSETVQPAFDRVVTKLDPSAQTFVAQQIAGLVKEVLSPVHGHDLQEGVDGEGRGGWLDSLVPLLRRDVLLQPAGFKQHLGRLFDRGDAERDSGWQGQDVAGSRKFGRDSDSERFHDLLMDVEGATGSNRGRGAWRTMEYNEERDGRMHPELLPSDDKRGYTRMLQGPPPPPPPPKRDQSERRIVRPYRRYASPGRTREEMAREDMEADAVARDAEVSVRNLIRAIEANQRFTGDRDPLLQEFLRSMKRYFAEGGDRAVAGVGTSDKRASISNRRHLAAHDPNADRIVFSTLFKDLTVEEKIITLIHEMLHTTLTMKNVQARSGYNRDREGGMIFAKHEAMLDNIAIGYAKRLGLIPPNYPETPWRRYFVPE